MLGIVGQTVSTARNTEKSDNLRNRTNQTTSINYEYGDPDLLIREYFLSSPSRRAKLRKVFIGRFLSLREVLEVLKWGISGKARDAYDGAVDLLAEINEINILRDASQYLETTSELWRNSADSNHLLILDSWWEILIKGIVCAYQIPAQERFDLIKRLSLSRVSNRRIIKATIIDAFLLLADEINPEDIRNAISELALIYKTDQYILNYAEEALQEI